MGGARVRAARLLALVCLLPVLGCRGGTRATAALVPVAGVVSINGQPLRLGQGQVGKVWFLPSDPGQTGGVTPSRGEIDPEGRYALFTAGKAGAPPGRYRVMVTATGPSDRARPFHRRRLLVHPRYSDVNTSGLVIEVASTPGPTAYDLRLAP